MTIMFYSSILRQLTTLLFSMLLMFSLVACKQSVEVVSYETDIPLKFTSNRLQAEDLLEVIRQAKMMIQTKLPQAAFTGLVVFGDCAAFPKIQGKVTLIFMQSKHGIWGTHSYMATASVSTVEQKMDIRIVFDPYLNYVIQDYKEAEMNTVLQNIALYIKENNITDCTVELAKIQDSWNVTCSKGEGENWEQVCHFTIDATSGKSGR